MCSQVLGHDGWIPVWNSYRQPRFVLIHDVFQQCVVTGLQMFHPPTLHMDGFVASFKTMLASITLFFTTVSSVTIFWFPFFHFPDFSPFSNFSNCSHFSPRGTFNSLNVITSWRQIIVHSFLLDLRARYSAILVSPQLKIVHSIVLC